jgi:hypothetical protein
MMMIMMLGGKFNFLLELSLYELSKSLATHAINLASIISYAKLYLHVCHMHAYIHTCTRPRLFGGGFYSSIWYTHIPNSLAEDSYFHCIPMIQCTFVCKL